MNERPTLMLRAVNYTQVVRKYLNGCYVNLSLPVPRDICVYLPPSISHCEMIQLKDSSGLYFAVVSNQKLLKEYQETGSFAPRGGHCQVCGRLFSHKGLGIFLRRLKEDIYVDGLVCSFNCQLSVLRRSKVIDPLYTQSELLLTEVCAKLFPGVEITPTPDPRIFEGNNGPIPYDSYNFITWPDNAPYRLIPVGVIYRVVANNAYVRTSNITYSLSK